MSFKSGCAIVLQDGSRVHTPVHHPSTTMDASNLYNLIQQYPTDTNITIPIPEIIEIPLTHLASDDFTLPDWDQFKAETLHPLRSLPFLARALIFTTLVLTAFLFIWCTCRRCKRQRIIPYVEDFNQINMERLKEDLANIRTYIKDKNASFTRSITSLTATRPSASTPNLTEDATLKPIYKNVRFQPLKESNPGPLA